MHETIQLARADIGEHTLTIQLHRDMDTRRERGIVFLWPPAPTVIPPDQLVAALSVMISALASARIELAAIRAAQR